MSGIYPPEARNRPTYDGHAIPQAVRREEDGIHVHVSKTRHSTGRKQIFTWVDEHGNDTGRRTAWDACLAARPLDIASWVFCTDEGECYVDQETWRTTNFNSVRKRFMGSWTGYVAKFGSRFASSLAQRSSLRFFGLRYCSASGSIAARETEATATATPAPSFTEYVTAAEDCVVLGVGHDGKPFSAPRLTPASERLSRIV